MTLTGKSRKSAGKRSGKWLIGLVLLIIGITPVVIWKLRARVPLLLVIATQVVPKGQYYGGAFAWLSNEEYLCFGVDRRTLSRYRLGSGVSTPLAGPFDAQTKGDDIQPSPNGKWLLWRKMTEPPAFSMVAQMSHAYITRLSDKHTQELNPYSERRYDFYEVQWEPDSRHIFDVYSMPGGSNETKVVIRDALANRVSQKVPFAPNVSSIQGETIMVAPGRLLGVSPMYAEERLDETAPVTITEYGLDKTLHIVRTWSVIPPNHPAVREVKISPAGDRIAWLVAAEYVDPALAQLHRLLPFIKAPSQPRQELWISRLDGTGMRVIGQAPMQVGNGNPLQISDLRWLPDGKHLSFEYDDALWTVPANR